MEGKYLTKIMNKQYKKIENLNKKILQDLIQNKRFDQAEIDSQIDSLIVEEPQEEQAVDRFVNFFRNIIKKKDVLRCRPYT